MAENILIGRVIAISDEETIASADGKKEPFKKRKLYIDCTQYDQWTQQPIGGENTPLLDFGGKALEQLNDLIAKGLAKGQVVQMKFKIVGRKSTVDGKLRIFNDVRPYAIEIYRPEYYSNHQPTGAQPAATPAPEPAQEMRGVDPAAMPPTAAPQTDAPQDLTKDENVLPF